MKERERILELVKKGILSGEEALDLLEAMATEKDERQIEKVADQVEATQNEEASETVAEEATDPEETPEEVQNVEDEAVDLEAQDKEHLEQILDDLATEANRASVELDEINVEIAGVKVELLAAKEELMALNTKEELDSLTPEELIARSEIEGKIKELEAAKKRLVVEKTQLEAELRNIRQERWSETKDNLGKNFEIPDEWKDQATETFSQVTEKVNEAGSQLGQLLKKTFKTVSDSVNDNMEWKDISVRVPGMATTKFEHQFLYEDVKATIIDVKVANGNITFKTWDQADVKVEGKFKLYGKMDSLTPMDALMERSQIIVDDEHISFQIPNKRVRADLTFYLPQAVYDHVSVKLLNGNIVIDELAAKDVYVKTTNGNMQFPKINATMLEIEGVNGNIELRDGEILDSIIETVNGDITVKTTPHHLNIEVVNGNIRATLAEAQLKKLVATSVNGNVKVALPTSSSLEGTAKTNLGSIHRRVSDYEIVREKKERTNQLLQFRRIKETDVAHIEVATTTGNIYLKDVEE